MNRLEDRKAIEDLIIRYAWALDTRDFKTLGECFADTCEFDSSPHEFTPGVPFPARGRDDIVALVSAAQTRWPTTQRRHVMTNIVIDFLGAHSALAKSYMTLFHTNVGGAAVGVALAGHYEDEVELVEDRGWLFRKRTVFRDGVTAA